MWRAFLQKGIDTLHANENLWYLTSLRQSTRGFKEYTLTKMTPLSWGELEDMSSTMKEQDEQEYLLNGPTNSRSTLRLFGAKRPRVTFYHDYHRWCPYCQKVWLWLETKRIPYETKRVTMFCYGEKENWYKAIVPSGMLPALEIDGKIITESDLILLALERNFGPLGFSLADPEVVVLRKLERELFRSWCSWLCYPNNIADEKRAEATFQKVVEKVETKINSAGGPYFLGEELSCVDVIFAPYVERMNASLFYYKGYNLRENVFLGHWFDAMEKQKCYLGTQSDHHTHVHDLPPQMGGCYSNGSKKAVQNQWLVDSGQLDVLLPDTSLDEPSDAITEAIYRVAKHRDSIILANPCDNKEKVEEALRSALTFMATNEVAKNLPEDSDIILRYVKDRISVPRDMSVWAARKLRHALERTAAAYGDRPGPPLSLRNRRDQDPRRFQKPVQ